MSGFCGARSRKRRPPSGWCCSPTAPDVPVEWSPPKFEAVDPQKDAMANLLSIRSGTMTLAEVIARQGRNPDAVLAEIAATNAKLDALGLVLDSDPRRVTKTGSAQNVASALTHDDEEDQPQNPEQRSRLPCG